MNFLKKSLPYLGAVIIAFVVAGIFILLMGYDPIKAYITIFGTSFKTPYGFIQTILKWIPLTLQALAFTIPFSTGKFNIGGEGQMLAGGIGAAAVGILLSDLPIYFLLPLEILAGFIAGALWGLIPAVLLYRFKINEILTTVLFNFIAFNLVDYVATGPWRDAAAGHPTTIPVGEGGFLPNLIPSQPLHTGVLIALLVAIGIYIYTNRTVGGFELIATGANPKASRAHGINIRYQFVLALVLGAALAGLSGAIEVAGTHHRLIEGMQSNFLQLGLIIGLIAAGNNMAVPFVAFFIAILEVGARAMQRTMQIPVEMVFIVEALLLIFILLSNVTRRRKA